MDSPRSRFGPLPRGTSSAWNRFAEQEPFYAVFASPRFMRVEMSTEQRAAFYESGDVLIAWMLDVIDKAVLPQFAPVSVLEFGCGPGRLALALARRCPSVIAVDSSPAMLSVARQEADRQQIDNVLFLAADEFAASDKRFDLVVCHQVLQRCSPKDAFEILEHLAQRIAPSGVGVFHWPIREHRTMSDRLQRRARQSVPGANSLANALKGRERWWPAVPTTVLSVESVQRRFVPPFFHHAVLEFAHETDVDTATLFAHKTDVEGATHSHAITATKQVEAPAALASATDCDIERSIETAELYFSSLQTWDHHLAKPFSQVEETPTILANLSVMLGAAALEPGMRVLEFGAGTGWLSRYLAQMGCHVTVVDVSKTALEIGKELFRRHPPIGDTPAPVFALFDGRRLPALDQSVDRVICFDAFHHALNPDEMIAEFSRVLVAGGRAVFAEPGPRHSESSRSHFETNTYGVVELDVDVHRIWKVARQHGFTDIKLCVFNARPHHVSLADYEDLLTGGRALAEWNASSTLFLRYVRDFYLLKGGSTGSPTADEGVWKASITVEVDSHSAAKQTTVRASVTNVGTRSWLASDSSRAAVFLGGHLYDRSGQLLNLDFFWQPLATPPRAIAPGERVSLEFTLPDLDPGEYIVEFDCVAAGVTWFAQKGSATTRVSVRVA